VEHEAGAVGRAPRHGEQRPGRSGTLSVVETSLVRGSAASGAETAGRASGAAPGGRE
jgi:hypothetical protein